MPLNTDTCSEPSLHCLYNTLNGISGLKRVKVTLLPSVMFGIFVHFLEIHFSPYLTVISVSKNINIDLMVYGDWIIFKRSNSVIFIFASLLHGCQLLKERICSSRSKFFPLRVDLHTFITIFKKASFLWFPNCFPKLQSSFNGVNFYKRGANSYFLSWSTSKRQAQNDNGRVAPLVCLSNHLRKHKLA